MNYILIILCLILMLSRNDVFAEENSSLIDNADVFNKGFSEQKAISDTKFKKTIKDMKERSLTKKQKKLRKEIQPNSPSADIEHLKMFTNSQDVDNALSQTLTVLIPVNAYSENGKQIQSGYYKLSCRRTGKDSYVLELSQGTQKVLSVEAQQTQQDLEQDTIQFCNADVITGGRIRLMYGTIDLNLVAYLYFDE